MGKKNRNKEKQNLINDFFTVLNDLQEMGLEIDENFKCVVYKKNKRKNKQVYKIDKRFNNVY